MSEDKENKKGKGVISTTGSIVKAVLSGEILASETLLQHLPYLGFLVLLSLIYIGIGYSAEDSVRQINRNKAELKEMRSEYITIKSDLMYTTKQSELIKVLHNKGIELEESLQPPKKIEITTKELEQYQTAANGEK